MKKLIKLFLLFATFFCSAQTTKDSLLLALKKNLLKDSVRCELLYKVILLEDPTIDRKSVLNELQSICKSNLKIIIVSQYIQNF
jgi:hypothetical protein